MSAPRSSQSSPAGSRTGAQEPRIRREPLTPAWTEGQDVLDLAREYAHDLDPWQRLICDDLAAKDADGRPLYLTTGISVPRQNGKNGSLECYELERMVAGEGILHTAHRVDTTEKSFAALRRFFTDPAHPDLCAMVERILASNGRQCIYLTSGGFIEYASRSRGGARGATYSLIVFDEAQELTDEQLEAIMSTVSASPTGNRQLVYMGTPPGPGSPGTVFRRVRDEALSDPGSKTCWLEWGVADLPPKDATFEGLADQIYQANPAMGIRLDMDFTEAEFRTMSLDGFARERLNWWSPQARVDAAIPADLWDEAAIEKIGDSYRGKRAFAVKFSQDGSAYALAGCKLGRRGAAVELVETGTTERGTKALAQALYEARGRNAVVVVDGMSGADALCDNLAELKAPRGYVVRPGAGAIVAAATGLLDELKAGTLRHSVQPALESSAKGCVRRAVGSRGGWGFGSTEAHDSTAIEAVSLALWGARTTKRDPRRKQRLL